MTRQAARSQQRSGFTFLLGAGFSKAVDPRMPTTAEMLVGLKEAALDDDWPFSVESGIERFDDLESWFDSAAVPQPYCSDSENSSAHGVFQRATQWIAKHISDIELQIVREPNPAEWLSEFLEFVDRERSHLTTLNYDTVVERAWSTGSDDWQVDLRLGAPRRLSTLVRQVCW